MSGRDDWRDDAACLGSYDLHYGGPDRAGRNGGEDSSASTQLTTIALDLCNGGLLAGNRAPCPVRDQCLAAAFTADDNEGVWGGITGDQRRALRLLYPDAPTVDLVVLARVEQEIETAAAEEAWLARQEQIEAEKVPCARTGCTNRFTPSRAGARVQRYCCPACANEAAVQARTHCKNGHPWTDDNTIYRSGGGRLCRTCKADANRRARLARADAEIAAAAAAARDGDAA